MSSLSENWECDICNVEYWKGSEDYDGHCLGCEIDIQRLNEYFKYLDELKEIRFCGGFE